MYIFPQFWAIFDENLLPLDSVLKLLLDYSLILTLGKLFLIVLFLAISNAFFSCGGKLWQKKLAQRESRSLSKINDGDFFGIFWHSFYRVLFSLIFMRKLSAFNLRFTRDLSK